MQKSFEIPLPGFTKDQISLTVEPYQSTHLLVIEAKSATRHKADTYILPAKYDSNSVQAKLDLGILTITANLKETAVPRRITVV